MKLALFLRATLGAKAPAIAATVAAVVVLIQRKQFDCIVITGGMTRIEGWSLLRLGLSRRRRRHVVNDEVTSLACLPAKCNSIEIAYPAADHWSVGLQRLHQEEQQRQRRRPREKRDWQWPLWSILAVLRLSTCFGAFLSIWRSNSRSRGKSNNNNNDFSGDHNYGSEISISGSCFRVGGIGGVLVGSSFSALTSIRLQWRRDRPRMRDCRSYLMLFFVVYSMSVCAILISKRNNDFGLELMDSTSVRYHLLPPS